MNYLNPNLKKTRWTLDEDMTLIKQIGNWGYKWKCMTEFIDCRSEMSIKNRFNSFINKIYDLEISSEDYSNKKNGD